MITLSISYKLLSLPPMLLLFLLMLAFSFIAGFGTWLFRKYIRVRVLDSHNTVAGNIFAMVGGFYGLLLAFVVFLVWDQFNDAQQSADIEGSLARGLYRDMKYFPPSRDSAGVDTAEIKGLTKAFTLYIQDVLIEDSLMDHDGPESPIYLRYRDTITIQAFSGVFMIIEKMHDSQGYRNQLIDQMFRHLNELSTYRSLRSLAADSEIDICIWVPLWLGAFITAIFAVLMDIENKRLHIFMNSLLGAFIALIFYIIILSDHPFNGALRIDVKKSVGKILEWEKSGMMEPEIIARKLQQYESH